MNGPSTHTEAELQEWHKIVKAKQELELAIARNLTEQESREYVQACRVAPSLVDKESNAAWFLQSEDFKVEPAAQKLTTYWRNRVKIFGERAFYPMLDLSGIGALSNDDIDFLKTGAVVQLADDAYGRSVTCNDISRLDDDARNTNDKEIRLRITFYFFTKIAMENRVQQEVVSIRILRDVQFQLQQFNKARFELVQESFPLKLHAYHICCLPTAGSRKQFTGTIIPATVKQMGKSHADIVKIHLDNPAKMAEKLEKCGLQRAGLPDALGGTWSYEDYLSKHFDNTAKQEHKRSTESTSVRQKKHSRVNEDRNMPPKKKYNSQPSAPQDKAGLQQAPVAVEMPNHNLQTALTPSLTGADAARHLPNQLLPSETSLERLLVEQALLSFEALRQAASSRSSEQQTQQQESLQTLRDLRLLLALQSQQHSSSQAPLQQRLEAANALRLLGSQGLDALQRPAADSALPAEVQRALLCHDPALIASLQSLSQDSSALERASQRAALVAAIRRASQGSQSNKRE